MKFFPKEKSTNPSEIICYTQYMTLYIIIIQEKHKCQTALIAACASGHKAVVELLICKGANSNYQNKVKQL